MCRDALTAEMCYPGSENRWKIRKGKEGKNCCFTLVGFDLVNFLTFTQSYLQPEHCSEKANPAVLHSEICNEMNPCFRKKFKGRY